MTMKKEPRPEGRAASPARRQRTGGNPKSITGIKRQRRGGGTWRKLGGGFRLVPAEEAIVGDYRLPAKPATPKQTKALDELITRFLRIRFIRDNLNQGLPPEPIAKAIGVKERTGYNLVKAAQQLPCAPEVRLVLEVLVGMSDGTLAGVLGTRRTAVTRWLFGLIDDYNPTVCQRHGLNPRELDGLQFLHAAFRLDYRRWR